ncbi:hypothetical protein ACOSQ2_008033 [Xanthoceras sorbifolium]
MKFKKAEFWVQVYNVPLLCMNKKVAKLVAESLGEVVEIPLDPKDCLGKFMRIKVLIDVTIPLKRGLRVWLSDFERMVMVLFKYERLLDFYFACGFLCHSFQKCSDKTARMEAMNNPSPKYGEWIWAPVYRRTNERYQSSGTPWKSNGRTGD